jgi:hypothetical protein
VHPLLAQRVITVPIGAVGWGIHSLILHRARRAGIGLWANAFAAALGLLACAGVARAQPVLGFEEIPNLIGAGIGTTPRFYGTRASPAMRPTARSSPSAASAIRSRPASAWDTPGSDAGAMSRRPAQTWAAGPMVRRAGGADNQVMATNVRVIHARDFIRARPDGVADVERAERMLAELAAQSAALGEFEILIDTRQVSGSLSAGQLWHLAEKFAQYQRTFARKTAILCPLERFDHARFFSLCAENRGCNVTAFHSYEEAMEWLIG